MIQNSAAVLLEFFNNDFVRKYVVCSKYPGTKVKAVQLGIMRRTMGCFSFMTHYLTKSHKEVFLSDILPGVTLNQKLRENNNISQAVEQ